MPRLAPFLLALLLPLTAGAAPADRPRGIVLALYTVQAGVMKMSVQLYPPSEDDPRGLALAVRQGSRWKRVARAKIVEPGWTAHFRVKKWNSSRDVPYRVTWGTSRYEGIVRRDPVEKDVIVAAAFTGNSPKPGGGGISKRDVVEYVNRIDPDVLLFTGDQVYNHHKHTEYWIRFGETFGDLVRSRPTVCLPDDHDVGHANLWGASGRATRRIEDGGYVKPPEYVNMVQRQQTWHLPDPYDPEPVERGITVYYTSLNVGGIDFALLEDRKFKSGCTGIVTKEMGPRPDHITTTDYDPASLDVPGKKLLGARQLEFLRDWAVKWDGAVMKCVVSQTVFSQVQNYHSRDKLFYHADLDSNGWPQSGRNRALEEIRRCFAFHVCGDQHLASISRYGIEEWNDAGYAFCVPSIANLWPRWWLPAEPGRNREPGAPDYTGEFLDGFGNRMTVYAVSNPGKSGREPAELHDRSAGFGIVRFDKRSREITMECWPRMVDPLDPRNAGKQYAGWPRTISQFDNYGRAAKGWLPTVSVTGGADPIVHVVSEATGELVYAVRASGTSFRPKVFKEGAYTLRVGASDAALRTFRNILTLPPGATKTLEVAL